MVTKPEIPKLTGRHEAHRAAQAATLELIAHAWNIVCTARINVLYELDPENETVG